MIYIYIQYKHLISPDDFLPRLTSRFSPISTHQESEVSNPNIDDEVQGQLRMMVPLDPMVVILLLPKHEILRSLQKATCKSTNEIKIFAHTQKLYIQII